MKNFTGHRGQSIPDFTNTALGSQPTAFADMLYDEESNRLLLASTSWVESTDEIVMTPNIINNHYFLGVRDWQSTPLTYLISMNTGNGNTGPSVKKMVQGAALDEANNRMLVLDGDDQLIAVDLISGNRLQLMEEVTGLGSFTAQNKDLEYDAVNKLLFTCHTNSTRFFQIKPIKHHQLPPSA
jgi:hypothetical protein